MAQIGSSWVSTSWVSTGGWADGSWGSGSTPTVVEQPAGGGRRIYDPDKRRRRYEPLSKRERAELDRAFRENAQPRYVAPSEQSRVTKRTAPLPVTQLPAPPAAITKPAERIEAAKHFLALDALESYLDTLERDAPLNEARVAHVRAQQNAQRLAAEQARIVQEALARQEADRIAEMRAAEAAERAAEAKRQADEAELLEVLLLVESGIIS